MTLGDVMGNSFLITMCVLLWGSILIFIASPQLMIVIVKMLIKLLQLEWKAAKWVVSHIVSFIKEQKEKREGTVQKQKMVAAEQSEEDAAVKRFVETTNERGKDSEYEFFKMGSIIDYGYDRATKTLILSMEDGTVIKGAVTFSESGEVSEWKSKDFVVYGAGAPKLLEYKVIRRDVEDVVHNDLYAYINEEIANVIPEGGRQVMFDCAEGLKIPMEEFIEKYNTPQYNKAWDEVITEVFDECGVSVERKEIGRYLLAPEAE